MNHVHTRPPINFSYVPFPEILHLFKVAGNSRSHANCPPFVFSTDHVHTWPSSSYGMMMMMFRSPVFSGTTSGRMDQGVGATEYSSWSWKTTCNKRRNDKGLHTYQGARLKPGECHEEPRLQLITRTGAPTSGTEHGPGIIHLVNNDHHLPVGRRRTTYTT